MRTHTIVDVPFRTQQFVILAAQTGSFHKVARLLGVDHTVVLRSIRRLEKDLGLNIFARNHTGFTITDAGIVFLKELQSAVDHVERACDLARYRERITQGPLRVGYSMYIHSRLIPILERMCLGEIPGLRDQEQGVELRTATTPQLVDAVLRGDLHLAFAVQPAFDEDLWVRPLAKEGFSLGISKNHRLARKPEIMAKEIDGERLFWVPRNANPNFYDHTVEYLESTGAKPSLREVLSFAHALEIVSQDFGVALLPRSATRLTHAGVLYKPITDKPLWIESAVCRRRDVNDDRIQAFLDALLVQLANQRLIQ